MTKNADKLSEEEKLLISSTLNNDRLIGTFMTPGEFLSLLDKAKLQTGSNPGNVEDFLIEAKQVSHNKYAHRLEGVLLKLAELLAEADHNIDKETASVRDRKPDRVFSSTTLASTHQMTGFTYSGGKPNNLLQKLTPYEMEALRRERDDLVQIYPELREMDEDLETHHIEEEDRASSANPEQHRLGMAYSAKTFETRPDRGNQDSLQQMGYEVALPVQRLRDFRSTQIGDMRQATKGSSYGDLGKANDVKTFSKTSSGFRMNDNKTATQDKRGPVNGKHFIKIKDVDEDIDPHRDFDSQRVEAPMKGQIRPRSNDYRIKRASKSSGGARPSQQAGASLIPKVSPYAQPTPAELEKKRRLQKLS